MPRASLRRRKVEQAVMQMASQPQPSAAAASTSLG
jgi:hypothetical protein